ncbi:hypothetical protein MHYP_G00182500 [Metynnis hypsauchen]
MELNRSPNIRRRMMDDRREPAQKQMESPHSVIHTYYQGDINAVVDEHFFRALNKSNMPKDLSTKSRENRRTSKPDLPAPSSWPPSWSKSGLSPGSSSLSQSSSAEEPLHSQGVIMGPLSADPWVYPGRQGSVYNLPQLYRQPAAAPAGGSSSYLQLLHMERPAGAILTPPSTKTDMQLEWAAGDGHRDAHRGRTHLDTGLQMPEKSKDVYWY